MNGLIGRWEAAGVRVREEQAERADEMAGIQIFGW